MLPEVAVVGAAFLRAVGRVVGAIQIEHDAGRHPVALPLTQIDFTEYGASLRSGADPRQAELGCRTDPPADPAVGLIVAQISAVPGTARLPRRTGPAAGPAVGLVGVQVAAVPITAGLSPGTDSAAGAAVGPIRTGVNATAVAEGQPRRAWCERRWWGQGERRDAAAVLAGPDTTGCAEPQRLAPSPGAALLAVPRLVAPPPLAARALAAAGLALGGLGGPDLQRTSEAESKRSQEREGSTTGVAQGKRFDERVEARAVHKASHEIDADHWVLGRGRVQPGPNPAALRSAPSPCTTPIVRQWIIQYDGYMEQDASPAPAADVTPDVPAIPLPVGDDPANQTAPLRGAAHLGFLPADRDQWLGA